MRMDPKRMAAILQRVQLARQGGAGGPPGGMPMQGTPPMGGPPMSGPAAPRPMSGPRPMMPGGMPPR